MTSNQLQNSGSDGDLQLYISKLSYNNKQGTKHKKILKIQSNLLGLFQSQQKKSNLYREKEAALSYYPSLNSFQFHPTNFSLILFIYTLSYTHKNLKQQIMSKWSSVQWQFWWVLWASVTKPEMSRNAATLKRRTWKPNTTNQQI